MRRSACQKPLYLMFVFCCKAVMQLHEAPPPPRQGLLNRFATNTEAAEGFVSLQELSWTAALQWPTELLVCGAVPKRAVAVFACDRNLLAVFEFCGDSLACIVRML